jgi:hypothetical protein
MAVESNFYRLQIQIQFINDWLTCRQIFAVPWISRKYIEMDELQSKNSPGNSELKTCAIKLSTS